MLSPAVISILSYALWVVLGFASAVMTFSMLTRQISKIDPHDPNAKKAVAPISIGRVARLLVIAILIYLALKWNFRYAITFVVALTVATWGLAIYYHLRAKKAEAVPSPAQTAKEEAEKND